MTDDSLQILSPLVDGEAVDPEALATALAAPGAREAIVDFVLLRAELRADERRPSTRFYAAVEEARLHGRVRRLAPARVLRGLAAAVILGLAVLGAISLPGRFRPAADQPPRAARVLQFTPGVDWHEGGSR
jgi:hypothetical protein